MIDVIAILNHVADVQEEQRKIEIQKRKEYFPSKEVIELIHNQIDNVCGKILRKNLFVRTN